MPTSTDIPRLTIGAETNFECLRTEWCALQARGCTTVYQTFEWCHCWHRTAGREIGTEPCIVTARDEAGTLRFLLPFGVTSMTGIRVVHWQTDPVATYGFGVFDPALLDQCGGSLDAYWDDICACLPDADALWLNKLPQSWLGRPYPFDRLLGIAGANHSYYLKLDSNFDELYQTKRPSKSRARARKKDKLLAAAGEVHFGLPQDRQETVRVLNDMFRHQSERLANQGVHGVFDEASQAFVHALSELPERKTGPCLRPYYLSVDGQIVAVKLGIEFGDTFWAMISSLKADGIERQSPGEHALRRTIEACCASGLKLMDMAEGDTGYKSYWADGEVALYTFTQAFSLRGKLWAGATALKAAGKRTIKTSPILWPIAQRMRTALLGRKTP